MLGNQPVRHGVMFAIVPMLPRLGFNFPLSLAEGFFHCLAASRQVAVLVGMGLVLCRVVPEASRR